MFRFTGKSGKREVEASPRRRDQLQRTVELFGQPVDKAQAYRSGGAPIQFCGQTGAIIANHQDDSIFFFG
jgi:hypothetical protein